MHSRHRIATTGVAAACAAVVLVGGAGGAAAATAKTTATATRTVIVPGTITQVVVDGPPGAPEASTLRTETLVSAGGQLLDVPAGQMTTARSGARVNVTLKAPASMTTSQALASAVTTAAAPLPATSTAATVTDVTAAGLAPAQLPTAPMGEHNLVVLPVYWTSPDSATVASLTDLAKRTGEYWSEQTGGKLTLTYSVRNWMKIPAPSGCDYNAIHSAARAAAGLSLPSGMTQHQVVYFPRTTACGWAGLGSVSGPFIWVNGYQLLDVFTHEFGHNLGSGHANSAECSGSSGRVPFSDTCTVKSYYDSADVMGFATSQASGSLNTALADYLGLVESTTVPATTTTSPTTVTLAPLQSVDALRAVKIPLTSNPLGPAYFIDYRPAVGRDVRRTDWAGVQIHYRPDLTNTYASSQILDLQPDYKEPHVRANLDAHDVVVLPKTNLTVRLAAVTSEGATVVLQPRTSDVTPPSKVTPLAPTAGQALSQRGQIVWPAATDSGGVASYQVLIDNYATSPATRTNGSTLLATLPSSVGAGPHSLRIDATDTNGNRARGPVVNFTVSAGPAPNAATITSPAFGAVQSASSLAVSWTIASPAPVVPLLDGQPAAAAVPAGTTSATISGIAEGRHALALRTVDSTGATVATGTAISVVRDSVAPTAATNLKYTGSAITWTAATDATSGVKGYRLSIDGVEQPELGSGTRSVPRVLPVGSHVVTVKAVDWAENASAAATLNVRVLDKSGPTPPAITSPANNAVLTSGTTTISWTPATDADTGIAAYRLAVGSTLTPLPAGATSAPVTLPEGRSTLVVTAVNGDGLTTSSAPVAVAVDTIAPAAVTGLALSADGKKLTWKAPANKGTPLTYTVGVDSREPVRVASTSAPVDIAPGHHAFTVTAGDQAGWTSAAATLQTWFDPTPPGSPTITSPAHNAALDTRAITLTWKAAQDADSGIASYTLSMNGKLVAAGIGPATTSRALTLAEGKNTISLSAANRAGRVSTSAVLTVTADTVAPAKVPGIRLAPDGTSLLWGSVSGSGTPVTYAVVVDGADPVTTANTSLPLTTTVAEHTYTVTATDAAGNRGPASTMTTWFDPTAPGSPAITTPADAGYARNKILDVVWTAATDNDGEVSGYRISLDGRLVKTTDAATRGLGVPATDGKHTLSVVAVNRAGVAGPAATVTVTVDTLAPAKPSAVKISGTDLTWTPGALTGAPVSWDVVTDAGEPVTVGTPALSLAGVDFGRHTWTVTARDAAGNAAAPVTFTGSYDTTAPSAPKITSPAANAVTGSAVVTWTAGADEDSGVVQNLVTVNGKTVATTAGGATSLSVPVADAVLTITVVAVNAAGGRTASAPVTFTYDRTSPTPVKTLAAPVTIARADDDVLTWTASTDKTSGLAGYVLYLDGVEVARPAAGATGTTVTTPAGKHVWSIAAVDKAGNISPVTKSVAVYRDSSAPSAPVITSPVSAAPAGTATSSSRTLQVRWTKAEDGQTGVSAYVVTVTGATTKTLTVAGTATSVTIAMLDGTSTITVAAANPAGLVSSAASLKVLVDGSAPSAPVVTAPTAKATTGTEFTVTWTAAVDAAGGITGYQVLVGSTVVATVDGATTSVAVKRPVSRPTATSVSVAAINGTGLKTKSAPVAMTIVPAA